MARITHGHLARLRAAADPGVVMTPLPEAASLEAVIDTAFWASLRREEGYEPRISLALVPPDQAPHPLRFAQPLPLAGGPLARLAPAVERPGIHLGVWGVPDVLAVWGTTWIVPPLCPVVEVVAPGVLVAKHRSASEAPKFVNIAVLEGDEVKVLDQGLPRQPDCPMLLSSLFGFQSAASWVQSADILVQLAVSMRGHGRGGTLLVVPAATTSWKASIVQPISYAVAPPFAELALLARAEPGASREAIGHAIAALAGLTAVDGATVITDQYDLLAFGAKIVRLDGVAPVDRVLLSEPIEGVPPTTTHPVHIGGTRHLSAVQFVHDQREAVALVASQDSRFTVFSWSRSRGLVQAYRIEALLM